MPVRTDMAGRRINLPEEPQRIVSLVPSQTELLFDLGLEVRVLGVTKFCIHPARARRQTRIVGGTKKFNLPTIYDLRPDLIIGNKEENDKDLIEALNPVAPVWLSDVRSWKDALEMIARIGDITGRTVAANDLAARIRKAFSPWPPRDRPTPSVLYLIWKDPWMAAAADTFIDVMLEKAGFLNAIGHLHRYPVLSEEMIKSVQPELIFLSTEPYPFGRKHFEELHHLAPGSRICLVDGEMFSWYGSRLLHAPPYFERLWQTLPSNTLDMEGDTGFDLS
ncbi:MAG: ABC transporter substrate-binding protein [Saprospiraceae bacterium]|nr:ABC transporter substrate-binding protein [Saprospiraceae bacterium]